MQGRRSWGRGPAPNILLQGPCINRAPSIIKLQHVLPCQSVIKSWHALCLNCPKLDQLIIRKIIRCVATRRQIFGGKNVQNSISPPPQTPFEELTALPLTPWLHLRGPISRGGEGKEREGKRRRKGGSKRSLPSPQSLPQIDATDCMQSFYDMVINLTLVVVSLVSWLIGPITKPWQALNLTIRTPDIADGSHVRWRSRLRACYYR